MPGFYSQGTINRSSLDSVFATGHNSNEFSLNYQPFFSEKATIPESENTADKILEQSSAQYNQGNDRKICSSKRTIDYMSTRIIGDPNFNIPIHNHQLVKTLEPRSFEQNSMERSTVQNNQGVKLKNVTKKVKKDQRESNILLSSIKARSLGPTTLEHSSVLVNSQPVTVTHRNSIEKRQLLLANRSNRHVNQTSLGLGNYPSLKICQKILIAFIICHILGLSLLFGVEKNVRKNEISGISTNLQGFASSNDTLKKNNLIHTRNTSILYNQDFGQKLNINEKNKMKSYFVKNWTDKSLDTFERNSWDDSTILPQWMKEYFVWHRQERQKIKPSNWKQFRYLVMRCLSTDSRCGGTADRIKTIPLTIYWAVRTKRILMIYWSRPAALEEFLVPPVGGIDWRVPNWLVEHIVHGQYAGAVPAFEKWLLNSTDVAVRSKLQSYNGGSLYYNEKVKGPKFEELYHDLWRICFTPSPQLQKIILEKMAQFGINAGNYASAHLRGLYARKNREAGELRRMAENAVKCASNMRPEGPIYFASDSKVAVDHIISLASKKKDVTIVTMQREYEPLHLEKSLNWQNHTASDYYDTFVDLYLIALSQCVAYNIGGYGQWGLWMSRNASCFKHHGTRVQFIQKCEWTIFDKVTERTYKVTGKNESVFLPAMNHEAEEIFKSNISNDVESNNDYISHSVDSVENSSLIPVWMIDYFLWHAKTRENLREENWNIDKKFLVMQCLDTDKKCGGLTDRIRPLPLMILLAARSKRLLFIQWTKPFPLEEFLVPPAEGLNWTLPDWLAPNLIQHGPRVSSLEGLVSKTSQKDVMVIRTLYQSNNYGSIYFNNQTNIQVSFEDVYHDLFSHLFLPAPPIAKIVDKYLKQSNLTEGEYAAAHFRVLHGRKTRQEDETKHVAINAINCASELRPGGPVFFASDNKFAVDTINDYSKRKNLSVFSLQHTEEPLHLDKAANWTKRSPSEYYATFVDLLLLGRSRCLAFNSGGFGTFGLILGFNASCSVRYFSKKIIKSCPKWIERTTTII